MEGFYARRSEMRREDWLWRSPNSHWHSANESASLYSRIIPIGFQRIQPIRNERDKIILMTIDTSLSDKHTKLRT